MCYRNGSGWSDKNELRCLVIFKKVKAERFAHGKQMEYCREMANLPDVKLSEGSISAKVGNFKSVAGAANPSNYSKNTERIYKKYKNYTIEELENIIKGMT